jgi:hypothetical protein
MAIPHHKHSSVVANAAGTMVTAMVFFRGVPLRQRLFQSVLLSAAVGAGTAVAGV